MGLHNVNHKLHFWFDPQLVDGSFQEAISISKAGVLELSKNFRTSDTKLPAYYKYSVD